MPCLLTLAPSFHSEMAFKFLKMSIIRKLVAHDQPVLDRRLLPGGADESADRVGSDDVAQARIHLCVTARIVPIGRSGLRPTTW